MPPPDRAAAQAAAAALALPLSDAQADRLLAFLDLLQRWNATYNLSAVRESWAMWQQHVLDCMAAVPAVERHLHARAAPARAAAAAPGPRILDVGSGGGLPGLVWAVLMPQVEILCVDAVAKKAAFMRQAAGQLGLANLMVEHARVEALAADHFDLVTSRAFSSLAELVRLTRKAIDARGYWVAMKGKPPLSEITELDWPAAMFHVEPIAVPGLAVERCLVWIGPAAEAPATSGPRSP